MSVTPALNSVRLEYFLSRELMLPSKNVESLFRSLFFIRIHARLSQRRSMAATVGSANAAIRRKSAVKICVSGKRAMSGPKLDMDVSSLRKTSNAAAQVASAHTTTNPKL